MQKKIMTFILVAVMLFSTSICVFAVTSDAPVLVLTEQEKEYFSELKVLRVLTVPSVQPYVYENVGLSIDILQRLCESAGVELQLIEAQSYADALTRLENKEAELAAVKILPKGEKTDILPYLTSPLQTVRNKQTRPTEQSRLSIAQVSGIDFSYDEKYSFVDLMTFSTVRECLDAVRGRRADIFLCDIYQLSVFSESFAARELTMYTVPHRDVTVGFGLRADTDERLISALQSTVASFSTSELGASLTAHTQSHEAKFELTQFVYENPFEILCAIISLFLVAVICIFVSFRIRASQQQELRGYEESYRMLADTFGEAGLEYDFLSDRFTLFGERHDRIDLPEIVEQAHDALASGTLRISLTPQDLDTLLQNNTPDQSYQVELQCGIKEGNWNWFRMIYIVVCTSESHRRPIRLIGCLVNIEEERREKERLLQIGSYDQLTGLLNRASGEREMIAALEADVVPKVLLFLDIDYFKSFNDQYGHSCGDAVLSALGTAMQDVFPQEDVLCRWGGDEFILLIKGERAQKKSLYPSLQKLQQRMQTFTYLGDMLPVTLSIGGIAVLRGLPFHTLFEQADATLYTVKNDGRKHFHIVYPTPDDDILWGEEIE